MPKNITITLPDGRKHTYEDVPDNVTQEQAQSRAAQEFAPRPIQAGSPQAAASTHSVATQQPRRARSAGLLLLSWTKTRAIFVL
jgi:hypothetical protein